jgi:hypothetical protein
MSRVTPPQHWYNDWTVFYYYVQKLVSIPLTRFGSESFFWVRIRKYLMVVVQFNQDQSFLLFLSVLRIRDVYSGSRILIFTQRIIEVFTQKIISKLSKIWVWDPQHWFLYS